MREFMTNASHSLGERAGVRVLAASHREKSESRWSAEKKHTPEDSNL
jgi:hypothetical protein